MSVWVIFQVFKGYFIYFKLFNLDCDAPVYRFMYIYRSLQIKKI